MREDDLAEFLVEKIAQLQEAYSKEYKCEPSEVRVEYKGMSVDGKHAEFWVWGRGKFVQLPVGVIDLGLGR